MPRSFKPVFVFFLLFVVLSLCGSAVAEIPFERNTVRASSYLCLNISR